MSASKDITVVVRSVGERTEQLCLHKLEQEVPGANIELIKNMPLHQSTAAVCKAAVNAGRKYTVMIGADYIPRVGFLQDLHDMAESMTGRWLFVKGTIIDKFLLEYRGDQGGPMLYPTEVLEGWLKLLPDVPNKMTTEATCQGIYHRRGYQTRRGKVWLALHDFEQHYRDIYRSMFIGGRKHSGHRSKLLPRWKQMAKNDRDYKVAIYAHTQGRKYRGKMEANYKKDYGWSQSPFTKWGKPPITDMEYNVQQFSHLQYLNQKGKGK